MRRIHKKWSYSEVGRAAGVALVLLTSASGRADPTPADVESAKVAFTAGLDLRKQNDLAGALARFRAAYALVPTPITGLEVARTLVDLGHVVEGRALLLEIAQMPKKPGESDKAQEARDEAADLAEKAKARLATITVDADVQAESIVMIDGATIPKDAALAPRVVDPGHHAIIVRTGERTGHAEVDLASGEQRTVHVELTVERPPTIATRFAFHPGPAFYASVVVAGVSLVVGVATGIPALATASNLSSECPSHVCPSSQSSALDTSLTLGWVSTVSFIVFGAAMVSSVVTFAISGRREASTKATVRIAPGLGTLALTGTF